uniref:Large ribosomal subunit protein uL23c n=1 Tax=Actinostachys pennula TaxID=148577 RepID=A0A1S5RUR4_9MONI|nr:ribosomal protein L23 [Actinostachys pennula]
MNKLKTQILTEKSIRLLERNQYTFEVDVESTKKEIKDWVENSFAIKVKNINSYRLPVKKQKGKTNYKMCYKRIIITLQKNHSFLLFNE